MAATTRPSNGDRLSHPLARIASVLLVLGVVTIHASLQRRTARIETDRPAAAIPAASVVTAALEKAEPRTTPSPGRPEPPDAESQVAREPEPPPLPKPNPIDRVAVAKAEQALDEASRDRARAEGRAAAAARRLEEAVNQAALDAAKVRKLAFRVRDPSAQISRVLAHGGFVRADRDKVKSELASLRTLPRPKATSILSKSPVARPAASDEFHFELRRNRVTYINLERLLDLARADAQVRIRMTDGAGMITSQVGPVESFSLGYILGRANPGIEELMERHGVRFDLKGWELIPESDGRGETYEATRNPISRYSQAVNRLNPGRSVITLWVYPDSFTLHGKLRAELVERGFSVAARPLPEGLMIRGSPMGSASAAQ